MCCDIINRTQINLWLKIIEWAGEVTILHKDELIEEDSLQNDGNKCQCPQTVAVLSFLITIPYWVNKISSVAVLTNNEAPINKQIFMYRQTSDC